MKNNKKILFVISYLYSGGAERALANITKNFPKDWDIDILLNGKCQIDFEYCGNILYLGIDDEPQMSSVFFHLKILFKRLVRMHQLKSSGEYVACISFLDSANVANILTRTKKCKTIISVRGSLDKQSKLPQYKYIVNPLVKLLYNQADKIIAVSKGIETELVKLFQLKREKIAVIENGYNIENIVYGGKEYLSEIESDFYNDKKVIITVGRLTDAKGQWHLIRAFSKLTETIQDARLVIIGGGELDGYLKQVASDLKIADKVLFVGNSDNPYKYVAKADVFVMSSLYEGFPNALAEAICLEIPCIATDFHSGARELIAPDKVGKAECVDSISEEKYGILTPCCSGKRYESADEMLEPAENELRNAMQRLLEDADLQKHYAAMSRQRKQTLGIEHTVQNYIRVILENEVE